MRNPLCKYGGSIALALAVILAGCRRSESERSTQAPSTTGANDMDLDTAIAKAMEIQRPIVVLIVESGPSDADHVGRSLLEDSLVNGRRDRVTPVLLDLSISRNRATAAQLPRHRHAPARLSLPPGDNRQSRRTADYKGSGSQADR